MKKKCKKNVSFINNAITFAIAVGIAVMIYPMVSQMYYKIRENGDAIVFEQRVKETSNSEIKHKLMLCKEYNDSIKNGGLSTADGDGKADGIENYKNMVQKHEKIGYIAIPKINQNLPIFVGISDELLEEGAGQMQGTSLPIGGVGNHSVIAAHSGLPNIRLFTDLNKLEIGDEFYITNFKETLAYKVDQKKVVLPTDFSDLGTMVGKDYVTLMTCTPYRVNTHRLLVRGHRVSYDASKVQKGKKLITLKVILEIALVLIPVLSAGIYYLKYKKDRSVSR